MTEPFQFPHQAGPPGFTQAQILVCQALLASAGPETPVFVGRRTYALLREYAEWKHDRQPITENPTTEPL